MSRAPEAKIEIARGPAIGLATGYLLYIALTFYWMATYSGPWRILCELQLSMFGGYYGAITMIALHLPMILASAASKRLQPFAIVVGWFDSRPLLQDLAVPIILVAVGGGFVLWLSRSLTAPERGTVTAAEVADAEGAPFFATVTGHLGDDGVSTRKGSATPMLYLPLRPSASAAGPVEIVVELQENEVQQRVSGNPAEGVVSIHGLVDESPPADVKVWLTKKRVVLAEDCRVLHTRAERKVWPLIMMGAIFLGFAAAIFYGGRRRRAAA